MFDQFFVDLQGIAHPEGAVLGVGQHAERQVADAERRETLFGVEAHGDPFREVGAQQRGYFRGVLLRHDDHAQFGTRFARDFLQAFERGFARGIRRMEKFDVKRESFLCSFLKVWFLPEKTKVPRSQKRHTVTLTTNINYL